MEGNLRFKIDWASLLTESCLRYEFGGLFSEFYGISKTAG